MKSVRLKLLILALLPLMVLMPLLLLLAQTRWTSDYDDLLTAKVDSDLRIAEGYLGRIMTTTGDGVQAVAGSHELRGWLAEGAGSVEVFLADRARDLGLDFLYYRPQGAMGDDAAWPVVAQALEGQHSAQIDIFSAGDLARFPGLAERAHLDLIATEAAVPTDRVVEDRGMVIHTAAPVTAPGHEGVLVGGILLNRNLDFIDTINALVYLNATAGDERQGTATLFLEDVRVSTNVRLFEDVRALGTRVSAEVRHAVLNEGRTWLARAFVVNDWYVSGYLPLIDSYGNRVGMLYVGFLEAPFAAAKRAALTTMLVAFGLVLLLSAPIFLRMARGIFTPLERMTWTMKRVERGDLAARNGNIGTRDEIGQVAAHLDSLLDQVQERDRELRAWAEELNDRVDRRTAQLSQAKQELEDTFQQLVMAEKLASIGEITAGVAHEINNPVAVIQGNVDVLRLSLDDDTAAEVATELDLIDRQVQRIDAIVGKLLQFAQPGDYGGSGNGASVAQVAGECLGLVGHVHARQQVDLVPDFHPAPEVAINPGELQQVVVNLLVNAIQAMEGSGRIDISVRPAEMDGLAGTELEVRDTGPGIDAAHMARVFDPFHTTKLGEGTGLGLSISQTLIRHAGGRISAANRPEGGARFTVWLPARNTDTPRPASL